jgi:hypothetical protein
MFSRKSLVRGLENQTESFHCFLNVILQALWCIDCVRDWFIDFVPTEKSQQSPVLMAISLLFTNYEWAETPSLPPDEVRKALALLYTNLGRFQPHKMDDAVEVFEAILKELHGGYDVDEPCAKGMILETSGKCLGHSVFATEIFYSTVCGNCLSNSGVDSTSNELVTRLYASEVTRMISTVPHLTLGSAIRATLNPKFMDPIPCSSCHGIDCALKTVTLLQIPPAICVSFVWTPESTAMERNVVMNLLDIRYPLILQEAFDLPGSGGAATTASTSTASRNKPIIYKLEGVVAFYGLHYVFFRLYNGTILQIDDAKITKLDGGWLELLDRCTKGAWRPVLAFFTKT